MKPLISVLIPAYNCAEWIGEAIDSIFTNVETCSVSIKIEIIVADDGSTDDTADVVGVCIRANKKRYGTLRYFRKEHQGIAATHNFLLSKAQGDLIAWCDDDDRWLPEKLQTQLAYLEQNPDCQIVFTAYEHFFENEKIKADLLTNEVVGHQINFASENRFYLPSSLARREVFDICGKFREDILTGEDDTEIVHRMQIFGIKSHYLQQTLYNQRLHANNATWTHSDTSLDMIKQNMLLNIRKNVQRNFKNEK
ncbi:hypothetical protein FACS1894182_07410 [Bacteroidia bacterium]|nr:hypothetical protein FACS1894182_07410 [Bacteroidia bacterium]